jgi:DNA-binding NarL/FixJ family response regulator
MSAIRILLADDHTVMRKGLRALLERQEGFQVVAEAADGREAVDTAAAVAPDIAIIDIGMPNLNGIEAARRITEKRPDTGVVILSMHADESYVLRALKSGARGYLLKDSPEEDLIRAVRAVHKGKAFFSPEIANMLAQDYMRQMQQQGVEDSYELLTPRERELLQMLGEGKSNKDVAAQLNLSLYTVETHRGNLLAKLNLHNTAELILYAVRKGIVAT